MIQKIMLLTAITFFPPLLLTGLEMHTIIRQKKSLLKEESAAEDILVVPGIIRLLDGKDNSGLYFKVISGSKGDIASWTFELKDSSGKSAANGKRRKHSS